MKKEALLDKTEMICYLAMGVALYIALSMTVKIPLIGHIQTDLGYIAFGVLCVLFGWKGFIVGTVGCLVESFILSGWFPAGWLIGQIFIGITCGICYKLCDKRINNKCIKYIICIGITAVSIAIGIIGIKTAIECWLYKIPLVVKVTKNSIAALADFIPMVLGYIIGQQLNKYFNKRKSTKNEEANNEKGNETRD